MSATPPLAFADIRVGDELTPLELNLDATKIVAGAIASRDFMPVHHDRDYAQSQGAPDIFMNILSTNGYIARFLTDWAGPQAMVKNIRIRLGAPAIPGQLLRFTGKVFAVRRDQGEGVVEVSLAATAEAGDHASGTAQLTFPLD
ncbi:MAG: MaoC family dehydratase [Deltaproteobacteria bacterium]